MRLFRRGQLAVIDPDDIRHVERAIVREVELRLVALLNLPCRGHCAHFGTVGKRLLTVRRPYLAPPHVKVVVSETPLIVLPRKIQQQRQVLVHRGAGVRWIPHAHEVTSRSGVG